MLTLAAALSLVLVAGCSSSASAKEPALTPLTLPADPMSISEPLDSYRYSENALKVIGDAL